MSFFGIPTPYEVERDQYLKRMIAWCCTPAVLPNDEHPRVASIYYILRHMLPDIPVSYRLNLIEERASIDAIFLTFQQRLLWMYFHGNLPYNSSEMRNWGEEDYYMYELADFLWHHSCEGMHNMGEHRLCEPINNSTYRLTEFGVVYQKLHYCVLTYCLRKNIFAAYSKARLTEIENSLSSMQINR